MARQATGPPLVRDDAGTSRPDAAPAGRPDAAPAGRPDAAPAGAPAAPNLAEPPQLAVDSTSEKTVELDSASLAGVMAPTRRGGGQRFLTDVIAELGLATREQVDAAIEVGRRTGDLPEEVLLQQGSLTPDGLAQALAERYGLDYVDLSAFKIDMAAANLVSSQVAKRYDALPIAFLDERTLLVAMSDPANVLAIDDIAILTGFEIRAAVATTFDVIDAISRLTRLGDSVEAAVEEEDSRADEILELHESADDAPVVKLVHRPSRQARPTSTSCPARTCCACASGSTVCCATSRPCRGAWRPVSSRGSRSWPSSTSPSGACRRTAASA